MRCFDIRNPLLSDDHVQQNWIGSWTDRYAVSHSLYFCVSHLFAVGVGIKSLRVHRIYLSCTYTLSHLSTLSEPPLDCGPQTNGALHHDTLTFCTELENWM